MSLITGETALVSTSTVGTLNRQLLSMSDKLPLIQEINMNESFFLDKTWALLSEFDQHGLVRNRCSKEFKQALANELERLFHATVEAQQKEKK